jgi:hypothetical protein
MPWSWHKSYEMNFICWRIGYDIMEILVIFPYPRSKIHALAFPCTHVTGLDWFLVNISTFIHSSCFNGMPLEAHGWFGLCSCYWTSGQQANTRVYSADLKTVSA